MGKKESIITLWVEPALKIFLWGQQRLRCRQAVCIFRFSCGEHPRCFRLGWGVGEKTFHLPAPQQQQQAVTRRQELLPVPLSTCPAAVHSGMDAVCFLIASPGQLQGGRAAADLLLPLGAFQPGSSSLREPSANCSLPRAMPAEQGGSSAWMAVPLSNTLLGGTAQCPVVPSGTVED